jgi:hypothetical protein
MGVDEERGICLNSTGSIMTGVLRGLDLTSEEQSPDR